MRHSSSEQINKKWTNIVEKKYSLRNIKNNDFKVPKKFKLKYLGFTYSGAKLFLNLCNSKLKTKTTAISLVDLLSIS